MQQKSRGSDKIILGGEKWPEDRRSMKASRKTRTSASCSLAPSGKQLLILPFPLAKTYPRGAVMCCCEQRRRSRTNLRRNERRDHHVNKSTTSATSPELILCNFFSPPNPQVGLDWRHSRSRPALVVHDVRRRPWHLDAFRKANRKVELPGLAGSPCPQGIQDFSRTGKSRHVVRPRRRQATGQKQRNRNPRHLRAVPANTSHVAR